MIEPKVLAITNFGNPILREQSRWLTREEILSDEIQQLITDIKYTVTTKEYGVGMAAPQVGVNIALARIAIKPTPTRPNLKEFDRVIINPEILETHGEVIPKWEGCISLGNKEDIIFGQTHRWPEITVKYLDDKAKEVTEKLGGLAAHVFQHELDHLNGVLFVDRVDDNKTLMLASEYKKRILPTLLRDE